MPQWSKDLWQASIGKDDTHGEVRVVDQALASDFSLKTTRDMPPARHAGCVHDVGRLSQEVQVS